MLIARRNVEVDSEGIVKVNMWVGDVNVSRSTLTPSSPLVLSSWRSREMVGRSRDDDDGDDDEEEGRVVRWLCSYDGVA